LLHSSFPLNAPPLQTPKAKINPTITVRVKNRLYVFENKIATKSKQKSNKIKTKQQQNQNKNATKS